MFYTTKNDHGFDVEVTVDAYAVDGWQVYVLVDGREVYDRRVIADSLHEALTEVLAGYAGFEFENADYVVTDEFGVIAPDYDEEGDD